MLLSNLLVLVSLFADQIGASDLEHCNGVPQRRWGKGGFGNSYRPGNRIQVDQDMADQASGHGFSWSPSIPNNQMFILIVSERVKKETGESMKYSIRTWTKHGKTKRVQLAWAMDEQSVPLMTFTTLYGAKQACVEVDAGWHGLYLFMQTI